VRGFCCRSGGACLGRKDVFKHMSTHTPADPSPSPASVSTPHTWTQPGSLTSGLRDRKTVHAGTDRLPHAPAPGRRDHPGPYHFLHPVFAIVELPDQVHNGLPSAVDLVFTRTRSTLPRKLFRKWRASFSARWSLRSRSRGSLFRHKTAGVLDLIIRISCRARTEQENDHQCTRRRHEHSNRPSRPATPVGPLQR